MSNVVVTELVVDARGAEHGTAAYDRAMKVAQAAIDRMLDRDNAMRNAMEQTSITMTNAGTSVTGTAKSWEKLRAAADPTVTLMKKIQQATLDADAAVRKGVTTQAEADRVLAQYVQTVQASSAAGREAAREAQASAAAQEKAAQAAARNAAALDDLRASHDGVYDASRRMAREIDELSTLESAGIQIAGGYAAALDKIILKYDETAQAALKAKNAQAEAARAFQEEQAAIASKATASANQDKFNDVLGVRTTPTNSAKDSAQVWEDEARAVAKLREEINPLGTAYDQMMKKIEAYEGMARRGSIQTDELSLATRNAQKEFDGVVKRLPELDGKVKLTGDQFKNLGYQVNDSVTMLASGSSLYQVAATQLGQFYQALDGPKGVSGSLEAMKNGVIGVVSQIGPFRLALAAGAAAAAAFWYFSGEDKAKKAEKALDSYEAAIRSLKGAYADAGTAADQFYARASADSLLVSTAKAKGSITQLKATLAANIDEIRNAPGLSPDSSTIGSAGAAVGSLFGTQLSRERASLQENYSLLTRNKITADEFSDRVAKVRLDPSTSEEGRKIADAMLQAAEAAQLTDARIKTLTESTDAAALAAIRMGEQAEKAYSKFRGMVPDDVRPAVVQLNEAFEKLKATANGPLNDKDVKRYQAALADLSRDTTRAADEAQNRLNNLSLNPDQRSVAEIRQRYDAEIADLARLNGSEDALAAKRKERDATIAATQLEITRAENARRAGYDLDLRAVEARTAAEKAQIAAERERVSWLQQGYKEADAAAAGERARTLALAQTAREASDALRESQTARDQAGLEGYAGQVAAINSQYQRQIELAHGSEAAVRSLTQARDLDLEALKANTAKSLFASQEDELRTLQAEGGLVGQNDDARRLALATLQAEIDLRRQGVDLNSQWGQTYVENARQIATMEVALDKQQSAFDGLKDAASGFFDALASGSGVMDALASTFGRFGQQLASKGFDQLFNKLLGNGGQGVDKLTGTVSSLSQAANLVPSIGLERTFSAPVGAMERKVVPALSSFSSELTAAAKAIRTIESGSEAGDYSAIGPVTKNGDRAYGAYQVMGNNIAEWSRSAIGREVSKVEFLRSVELQDKIFEQRFGGYMQKYGAEGASRAWFAGEGGMRNWNAKDAVGTSVGSYNSQFSQLYSQHGGDNGYRTASSIDERRQQKATAAGVKEGLTEFSRQPSYGDYTAAGVDPWNTGGVDLRNSTSGLTSSGSLFGIKYPSFSALGGLSAGLGGFGAGYSSGSALGGGLQGAVGGFMSGGPVGAVIGGIAGLFGGILGKNKQKKQEEEEAKRQWEGMQPQYEAYRRYLSGEESGNLRTDFQNIQAQFNQYNAASTKAKNGDLVETARSFYAYVQKQLAEFRESSEGLQADLEAGIGPDGPFAKGKSSVRQLQKQLQGYLDDVAIAYFQADNGLQGGAPFAAAEVAWKEQREAALAKARRAAQDQALSVLNPPKELSSVESNFRSLQGAAQQLLPTLQKLGMEATEAAKRIDEELNKAIAKMAADFVEGLNREINGLSGKGYFNDVADLLSQFDTNLSNAALLNVDPAIVNRWFTLSAQGIVDGAELAGDAFAELMAAFPQLAGVVKEFAATATVSTAQVKDAYKSFLADRLADATSKRAEAEADLRSEYQRTVSFISDLKTYQAESALDRDASTLTNEERLAEAERQYRETLALASGGDTDAQSRLVGAVDAYRREARDFYATQEGYGRVYDETSASLKDMIAKTETELDVARRQASFLGEIAEGTKGLSGLMKDYLDALQVERSEQAKVDGGRSFGLNPIRNRSIDTALKQVGFDFGGSYGKNASGVDEFYEWRKVLPADQLRIVEDIIDRYIGINRASGGPVYGAGTSTSDSIRANLSNGEYVMRAASVSALGVPAMDHINRTGTLPRLTVPRGATYVNDNRSIVEAIGRLERASSQNAQALAAVMTSLSQEERRESREQSGETERRRESSGRLAARRGNLAA